MRILTNNKMKCPSCGNTLMDILFDNVQNLQNSMSCCLKCGYSHRTVTSQLSFSELQDLTEKLPFNETKIEEFPLPTYIGKHCPLCGSIDIKANVTYCFRTNQILSVNSLCTCKQCNNIFNDGSI